MPYNNAISSGDPQRWPHSAGASAEGARERYGGAVMDRLCIRRITVEPDGVVLLTQSGDGLLREWKHDGLTAAYQWDGQRGLDLEVFRMLCNGSRVLGRHSSTARYRRALRKGWRLLDGTDACLEQLAQLAARPTWARRFWDGVKLL